MKAYTSLEQSKKLAEILPIESADMYYRDWKRMTKYIHIAHVGSADEKDLPCWSLAALVNVLPRIDIEKEIWHSENYDYRVKAYISDGYVGDWYDNPIDACVEMIVRLKERNLI